MTQPCNPFTQTGALARHDPLFRGRTSKLAQLERACLNEHKSFLLVYGGRQNGKTSLLLRLEANLREHGPRGVRVCRVDFQDIPRVTTDAAFQHLIAELRRNLPHMPPVPAEVGIPELRGFLEQALAGSEVVRLVLLLDELARLPETTRQDLAHVIRALHTHRLVSPALAKTQFVLAGGMELYDLAIVQASTLRNVCEIVRLSDLSERDGVDLIVAGLTLVGVDPAQADALGHAVYARLKALLAAVKPIDRVAEAGNQRTAEPENQQTVEPGNSTVEPLPPAPVSGIVEQRNSVTGARETQKEWDGAWASVRSPQPSALSPQHL